ncbi:uncharacterized protein LOC127871146 [Dreissena polymorpha]|uniref:uncharacterized protein LOC127871146 n=1 Tax=Dreissena polymorpha TaxID=45954 RepID=UPI002264A81F|nr:uncharacterized protein LOC127871146 [Dreissena polymorpha]
MRFSKPRDGQLEDLERLFLSHHRVCDFLRDSFNDFDASICDWMYQSEYIEGGIKPELIYSPGIQDCEWYRSQLSNEGAKKELKNKPPGAFLVRQATTNTAEPGGSLHVFTLEFVDEHGRIKKLMIMKTGDVYHFKEFLTQKHEIQTFETVSDLVAKVLTSGLEIKDSRTKLLTIFHVKPVWRNT